jgi:ribosomal protein S18 acetylase RimI-like enzyme
MTLEEGDLRRSTTEVEVREVRDEAGLAQALDLATRGFEIPAGWLDELYGARIAALPTLTTYVAFADGSPVSTGLSHAVGGSVGIFNVGTPPEHRGRGYGAAVTARAAADGLARGASPVWLQSSPMGASVYRRLGFRTVGTYRLYERPAPSR